MTCSGRNRTSGKTAQVRSCSGLGPSEVRLSSRNATVEAIVVSKRRRSKPCRTKSSANNPSTSRSRQRRGSSFSGMASMGSMSGRPSSQAQARFTVAWPNALLSGCVTQAASTSRERPVSASNPRSNGRHGATVFFVPVPASSTVNCRTHRADRGAFVRASA